MSANTYVAIVDDEQSVCRSVVRLLNRCGFYAEGFDTATGFLEALAHSKPGCLVLDLRMPGMNGIELLRRMAELRQMPPVVVLTAEGDAAKLAECQLLGARLCLSKPVGARELISAVRVAAANN